MHEGKRTSYIIVYSKIEVRIKSRTIENTVHRLHVNARLIQ